MNDSLKEHRLDSKTLFTGKVICVSQDTVRLPNGNTASREVVHHPGAVAVLATTSDDRLILVEQYRYACQEVLLEIPAGKLNAQEDPKACAFRELAEETPYTATEMELIFSFYTAAGFCNELMYLYQAKGLQANSTSRPDEDEFVRTVYLTPDEVKNALISGKIRDSKTIIALQYWLLHHQTS